MLLAVCLVVAAINCTIDSYSSGINGGGGGCGRYGLYGFKKPGGGGGNVENSGIGGGGINGF
ncbi:hypothetical protein DERP_004222 [Dermatophagoides pteronyssinus]|uniref:Uncharacterized protein n=1 Tax=Dermatophagoides pteronyssinus TaxID=6956 RepID=A0ABQ8J8H4_DERPT|nr:hypothetical protein DERP_004222 [Dermatophagoides pteronyssinus]